MLIERFQDIRLRENPFEYFQQKLRNREVKPTPLAPKSLDFAQFGGLERTELRIFWRGLVQ